MCIMGTVMKYFPLVWAAIWRKPARTVLTLLSVTAAFLLFGLMIGINATARAYLEFSRQDRIYVSARFGGPLSVAQAEQIRTMPGVRNVSLTEPVFGYYQDPKKSVFALMVDDNAAEVFPELLITAEQLQQFKTARNGLFVSRNLARRLNLKVGDPLPIVSPGPPRADGSKAWQFKVIGLIPDRSDVPSDDGEAVGSFDYFDQARIAPLRGKLGMLLVLARDVGHARDLALAIDRKFINAPVPTRSVTERDAFESGVQNGIDVIGVTQSIAAAGLFMILFLTGNTIAQSVRERIPEFAALKTIGFSDTGVMAMVFAEAVMPCLFGAALGIGMAAALADILPHGSPAFRFRPSVTAFWSWPSPLPLWSPLSAPCCRPCASNASASLPRCRADKRMR